MPRLTQLASLLSLASAGLAQNIPNIIPFTVVGSLDDCSAGTEYNSGGTLKVNEFTITVPENLIVSFPTVYAPWPKACNEAGARGYETTVTGNIIGGKPIAGQIQIAGRFGLEGSQGYIESITDGVIQIAGGPRVRINDPEGAYAPKVAARPYFVMDTENPSVSSFSGFPMCIQHSGNAETCKDSNRLTGGTFNAPDPLAMVPLKAGDFIEYSGLTNNGEILAHSVTCLNIQVTTQASDTVPNYIRIEDMIVGVPDTAANVEFADMKIIGFLSSCSGALVTISAIDVDPCTGAETLRRIGSATPKQEARCKWEARIAPVVPFTRDYMITTNTPVKETKNKIKAGQYVAPVTEWIFPEVDVPGTFPPPFSLNDIQAIHQGDFLDDQQFGPLKPYPGPNQPAAKKTCSASDIPTNDPPTTTPDTPGTGTGGTPAVLPIAAAVQFTTAQRVAGLLTLSGSNTETKLTNDQLNFNWTQTAGPTNPAITITNANTATASFAAPKVTSEQTFNFTLTISLKSDPKANSTVVVPIKINPTAPDVVTMDSYTWESSKSGSISVACSSNVRDGSNKKMTLLINGATSLNMGVSGGNGRWAYTATKTNRPTRLQCVSDLTGKSAERLGTQTTRRRRRGVLGML